MFLASVFICFKALVNSFGLYSDLFKPTDMYNFKTVESTVKKNYNISKDDFEISYFNDSYIFITKYNLPKKVRDSFNEINKENPKEILILKSDTFFKDLE